MNTRLLFFFALCLVGLGAYCISLIWHRRLLTAKDNEIAKLREELLNLKLRLANRFSEFGKRLTQRRIQSPDQ